MVFVFLSGREKVVLSSRSGREKVVMSSRSDRERWSCLPVQVDRGWSLYSRSGREGVVFVFLFR